MWTCALLFTFSIFQLVVPNLKYGKWLGALWIYCFVCELLLPFIPARQLINKIHNFFAFSMVFGMLILVLFFARSLNGAYAISQIVIFILMLILAMAALILRKHFIYFQLPYIYLSHLSVVVAVLALS